MKKSFSVLSVLLVLLGITLVSCGNKAKTPDSMEQMQTMDHTHTVFSAQTLTSEEGKMGEHVVCPVSGEKIMITEKTPYSVFEGRKIYIAGDANKKLFEMDPKKYLSAQDVSTNQSAEMKM